VSAVTVTATASVGKTRQPLATTKPEAQLFIPFDTIFDTASRFSVLNGIKWQHGGRVVK
jgi:hypothetical protein